MDNGDIITGLPNLDIWDLYLPKMEETVKNVRHRLEQVREIIGGLNGIWWSKDITKNRKKMIYNSMVKSVLTY